jgi:hypothetical protein
MNPEVESSIRQAVVGLNRAFDEGDWEAVRSILSPTNFVATATVQFGQKATIPGADTMLKIMKDIGSQREASGIRTMHVLGELTITVRGDEAEAFTYQTAYLYRSTEISAPTSKSGSRGTYHLKRISGSWKIVNFDVDRVWLEGEPY